MDIIKRADGGRYAHSIKLKACLKEMLDVFTVDVSYDRENSDKVDGRMWITEAYNRSLSRHVEAHEGECGDHGSIEFNNIFGDARPHSGWETDEIYMDMMDLRCEVWDEETYYGDYMPMIC